MSQEDQVDVKIFTGSEHTKSSTSYSMEIQIVHFREDLSDLDTALANSDWNSIAIVSIFYNVQYKTYIILILNNSEK